MTQKIFLVAEVLYIADCKRDFGANCFDPDRRPGPCLSLANAPERFRDRYIILALAAVKEMRTLPDTISADCYWALAHVPGACYGNPIPSLEAAISAIVDEILREAESGIAPQS